MNLFFKIILFFLVSIADYYFYTKKSPKIDSIRQVFHWVLGMFLFLTASSYLSIIDVKIPICLSSIVFYPMPAFFYLFWLRIRDAFQINVKYDKKVLWGLILYFAVQGLVWRTLLCFIEIPEAQ